MINISNNLTMTISEKEKNAVKEWWNSLTEMDQEEIRKLCEEKRECGMVPLEKEVRREEKQSKPFVVIGKFESSKNGNTNKEWYEDMYEYLVAHPEAIILAGQFEPRAFHICTFHQKAREVLKNGVIPNDFLCPFADSDCCMLKILQQDPGKSLNLFAFSFPV
jgi:hypothetical protein